MITPSLYPNPVLSDFNVDGFKYYQWTLKNTIGQIIKSGNHDNTNIQEVQSGFYFLEIKQNDQLINYRIIKQ